MENKISTRLEIMTDIKLFMRYGSHSGNAFEVREGMGFRHSLHFRYDSWFDAEKTPLIKMIIYQ